LNQEKQDENRRVGIKGGGYVEGKDVDALVRALKAKRGVEKLVSCEGKGGGQ